MTPTTIIETAGHELYKTRVVGKAWDDALLETLTPFCVLYERGKTGAMVAAPYPPGYLEREQERREALEEIGCKI